MFDEHRNKEKVIFQLHVLILIDNFIEKGVLMEKK